ncbi:MAG: Stp1/IreP family PP2C-type Ser/Thr phosphatase [Firmicutes bacterium]|nr:Stp1/IreP family PP2C-type Ser/Thr phosphatase [Bacillota bacterium]
MYAAGRSDAGKVRPQNEDSVFVSEDRVGPLKNLFIVADGLGGHNGGEVASAMAVDCFTRFLRESREGPLDAMMAALSYANGKVYERAEACAELYGMGTTFSACSLQGGRLFIVHIGDSRIYRVSRDGIFQLTSDHSYVNEMVKAGRITKAQAEAHPQKNIITKALGLDPGLAADGIVCDTDGGGFLLLCSDGLTDMLSDTEISDIVNSGGALEAKADALIRAANERGGVDNISAVLIDVSAATAGGEAETKAGCPHEV